MKLVKDHIINGLSKLRLIESIIISFLESVTKGSRARYRTEQYFVRMSQNTYIELKYWMKNKYLAYH